MTNMSQTPVHHNYNVDLLSLIPATASRIIEVGCSSGAMARAYKALNSTCHYLGIDIDPNYAEMARNHCDQADSADIETLPDSFFLQHKDCDVWIFGDTLEHLKDPWSILRKIRSNIPLSGCVVACIPNAQHWSVVARLCAGEFRYEESGLLDKTHLRWFTRKTIIDLFQSTGFQIEIGNPRIFPEPQRDQFLPVIGEIAELAGLSPEEAMQDATPLQYVIRATPV